MPPKKSPAHGSSRKSKLTIVRDFAAPRALVFAAWTQPAHLKRWSAPRGFKIPESEGDLRPGGAWRAVMVGLEVGRLELTGVYRGIVPDRLLVFTHRWVGEETETTITVRFSDLPGGGTRMKFEQTGFASPESRDGHGEGWSECFDRLDELLAGKKPAAKKRAKR